MTRVETIKAIRAFLEANGLKTDAVKTDDNLTHYLFAVNIEEYNKAFDVLFSVGPQGDFSITLYIDINGRVVNELELYRLINWLNIQDGMFGGAYVYLPNDDSVGLIQSVDAFATKDIYGEDISYRVKIMTELVKEYLEIIERVLNGEETAIATSSFVHSSELKN